MRIAREADVPVILVADVDRGGALAAVVGTLELLGNDRPRVRGIIYNMFRGDIALFRDAVTWTEKYTGVKVLGVLPCLEDVYLPPEDSLSFSRESYSGIDEAFRKIADSLRKNLDVDEIINLALHADTMPLHG